MVSEIVPAARRSRLLLAALLISSTEVCRLDMAAVKSRVSAALTASRRISPASPRRTLAVLDTLPFLKRCSMSRSLNPRSCMRPTSDRVWMALLTTTWSSKAVIKNPRGSTGSLSRISSRKEKASGVETSGPLLGTERSTPKSASRGMPSQARKHTTPKEGHAPRRMPKLAARRHMSGTLLLDWHCVAVCITRPANTPEVKTSKLIAKLIARSPASQSRNGKVRPRTL
mmetsp:Transcript_26803/g.76511  ORF Transcript_26803/g.76511 Transcript_26803/m.76511 type:complete len:228 (-) Transcript_26803:215-898(-)